MRLEEIKEISIDIQEINGKIVCRVEVPAYSSHYPKKIRLRTPDIHGFLTRKGYTVGAAIDSSLLDNRGKSGSREATWSFEAAQKPKPVAKKRPPKPRIPKTTKKTKE
jgi:hypothetical protein